MSDKIVVILIFLVVTVPLALILIRMGNAVDRMWSKNYPPLDYLQNSQEIREPWRWRKPSSRVGIPYESEEQLGIKNEPEVSRLFFQVEFRLAELTAHIGGTLILGFALLLFLNAIFLGTMTEENWLGTVIIFSFLFSSGFLLLQWGDRVLAIELYPERVGITTQFAFGLRRTTFYQRKHLIRVKGKIQSFWSRERLQFRPDYKMKIRRSIGDRVSVEKTFSLHCNPTQGAWVVDALNHWKSRSRLGSAGRDTAK